MIHSQTSFVPYYLLWVVYPLKNNSDVAAKFNWLIYFLKAEWRQSKTTSCASTRSGSTTATRTSPKSADSKSTPSSKKSIGSKKTSVIWSWDRLGQKERKSQIILPQRKNLRFAARLWKISRRISPQKRKTILRQIKLNPTNGDCWNTLAHVLFKKGDIESSQQAVTMALEHVLPS